MGIGNYDANQYHRSAVPIEHRGKSLFHHRGVDVMHPLIGVIQLTKNDLTCTASMALRQFRCLVLAFVRISRLHLTAIIILRERLMAREMDNARG